MNLRAFITLLAGAVAWPLAGWTASARRPLPRDATSSMPNRLNSKV
jgi:hypothetical protein